MKRIISAFIALCILIPLSSCSGGANDTTSVTGADITGVATETANETVDVISTRLAALPEKDYNGQEVSFLVASETLWGHEMINSENLDGEPINDEIYERNRRIEERYNVKIVSTQEKFTSIGSKISVLVQANDAAYDIMLPRINAGVDSAQKGYFMNLLSLNYISTDSPWWDGNIVKDLSIGGKCFFLTGDIHLYANDATHIILFNKKLAQDYNIEDLYGLVGKNGWTFDKFNTIAKTVISDVNGDGNYLWGDRFGLQCANYAIPALLSAAASPIFSKADENNIEVNINTERFNKVYLLINSLMNENNTTLNMEDSAKYKIPGGDFSHEWYEAMDGDQALFMIGVLDYMNIFKNVERNFGILPLPKLDETQEKYISPVMADAMAICVPVTVSDPEMVGLILEAMAVESYGKLRGAYYDITLQRKQSRDVESADMLDIIFSSRSYPLDMVYNWGSMSTEIINAIKSGKTDIASVWAKKESAVNKAIEKAMNEYVK